jgi:phosphatidylethanolamine/phosphatidyl-N-methylethanolamine N-methyltransferase
MQIFAPVTFFKQTLSSFRTTGAVAPSSVFLAKAMVRSLPTGDACAADYKVLEVGPGTGPFSAAIAQRLKGRGELHLYEINSGFVAHLKRRIEKEPCFKAMGERVQLHEGNVLELQAPQRFDAIVSGLPFNNFTPDEVRSFLEHFRILLKHGGTLTFFEYFGMRPLQMPFVGREKRTRLNGIARVVNQFAREFQVDQQIVLLNVPPARARHMKFA